MWDGKAIAMGARHGMIPLIRSKVDWDGKHRNQIGGCPNHRRWQFAVCGSLALPMVVDCESGKQIQAQGRWPCVITGQYCNVLLYKLLQMYLVKLIELCRGCNAPLGKIKIDGSVHSASAAGGQDGSLGGLMPTVIEENSLTFQKPLAFLLRETGRAVSAPFDQMKTFLLPSASLPVYSV